MRGRRSRRKRRSYCSRSAHRRCTPECRRGRGHCRLARGASRTPGSHRPRTCRSHRGCRQASRRSRCRAETCSRVGMGIRRPRTGQRRCWCRCWCPAGRCRRRCSVRRARSRPRRSCSRRWACRRSPSRHPGLRTSRLRWARQHLRTAPVGRRVFGAGDAGLPARNTRTLAVEIGVLVARPCSPEGATTRIIQGVVGLPVAIVVLLRAAVARCGEHGALALAPHAVRAAARAEPADPFFALRSARLRAALDAAASAR